MRMRNDFEAWLQLFARWLRDYHSTSPKPLMTEERWIEEKDERVLDSRLSLIPQGDNRFHRPGAVCTWKLVHRDAPNGGVLITLDNLLRLRNQLPPNSKNSPVILQGLERSMGLTHRFQAIWLYRYSADSRLRFILLTAIDIDLSSHYVDESACEVVRYVALDCFNMRSIPSLSWKERVSQFPWYESISQFAPKKGCPSNPRCRVLCRRVQKVSFS